MTSAQDIPVYQKEYYFPAPAKLGRMYGVLTEEITLPMLEEAYWHGYFPWPDNSSDAIPWAHPHERGMIFLPEDFHIPHTVKRLIKKGIFELRIDTVFEQVIRHCALRNNGEDTWITDTIIENYIRFHQAGWAHSFETWNKETGELAGGLYGISIGGVFAGESMFFRESGASKFALAHLGMILQHCGGRLMDTQMVTPTTELFGAKLYSRQHYLESLERLRSRPLTTEEFQTAAAMLQ